MVRFAFTASTLLTLVSLTVQPSPALANEQDNQSKAKTAFDRGRQNFEQDKFKEAADAFREAYNLMPTWKLLYNIGQAEAAAKRYGLALDSFERYLATGGDQIPEDRKNEVISETTRLRAMVGSLDIKAPDGAVIYIDNLERGKSPLPGRIKVTAGIEHTLFVELDNKSLIKRTVMVSGGETILISALPKSTPTTIAAQPEEPARPGEPAQPENSNHPDDTSQQTTTEVAATAADKASSPLVTTGWFLTGTGAAILIGGTITGLKAVTTKKDLTASDNCDGTSCTTAEKDNVDALKRRSTITTVLMIAGSAVTATGISLLVVGKLKSNEKQQVQVAPVALPQFAGLTIQGRF